MATRGEIAAVYAAGVAQGVALVTFPAASAIFTGAEYGLSSKEYGAMFVPQALTAVGASLLGAGLGRRLGVKRIYLLGLAANLVSMALLVASRFVADRHGLAYGVLLVATAALGIGFGFTVPALNTLAAAFFPSAVDSAVLVLNALLGLGTALAPAFVALFVGLGLWWGLPVLVALALAALLLGSLGLPLGGLAAPGRTSAASVPARFWVFAGFALLYGVVETINGNWATLYMARSLGATAAMASLALTVFWATVTAGRVLFAAVERWVPPRLAYRALPFVCAVALVLTSILPEGRPSLGILAFALAGLGCSALLPLTISLAEDELAGMAASVAGGLVATYQVGYGIAAFGVGPVEERIGRGLGAVFGAAAAVAVAMAGLAFLIVGGPGIASRGRRR
ncbi:MAG TPA: MFS transporter [Candidatus Methylomirabilis sp.]|nr:MFS transporter [Candidatus Methylomirabilis sp.]